MALGLSPDLNHVWAPCSCLYLMSTLLPPSASLESPQKKPPILGQYLIGVVKPCVVLAFKRQKKRAKRQTTAKGWYVSKASTLHIITMHYICITIFAWTSRICEGFNVKNVLHICQIGAPELILGCTSAFTRLSWLRLSFGSIHIMSRFE